MSLIEKYKITIENLRRTLRSEKGKLPGLRNRLITMLADTAIADDQTDPETFLNLRREIEVAERAAEEMPLVIELLESRLGQMESEDRVSEQDATRIRNDELFFKLLGQIITDGEARPADLVELCRYAASSSNPARRFDITRLTESLEDHARRTASARSYGNPLPVFKFLLEEQLGK